VDVKTELPTAILAKLPMAV